MEDDDAQGPRWVQALLDLRTRTWELKKLFSGGMHGFCSASSISGGSGGEGGDEEGSGAASRSSDKNIYIYFQYGASIGTSRSLRQK